MLFISPRFGNYLNLPNTISINELNIGYYHSTQSISSDTDTIKVIDNVCKILATKVKSINEIDTKIGF